MGRPVCRRRKSALCAGGRWPADRGRFTAGADRDIAESGHNPHMETRENICATIVGAASVSEQRCIHS